MTASTNMGNGPKRSQTPLWRRKANYVLRELVRAWHGLPYDTAVIWGLGYAFADILHTFAKEHDLPIPKLFFWFDRFWEKFAKYLGVRVFMAADRSNLLDFLLRGFPADRADLCRMLVYDEAVYGIMHISSVLFLREVGKSPITDYFSRKEWSLEYYESLEVAPLDSFTIWYVKRTLGISTET